MLTSQGGSSATFIRWNWSWGCLAFGGRKRVGFIATDFSSPFFDPLSLRVEARVRFPNSN